MSFSLFTETSIVNDSTCEYNLKPPHMFAPLLRLFSVPIIMQEQKEKAYQHGKVTDFLHKHWEKSSYQSNNRAGDPPRIFSMACVFIINI